jgi:hypothetical protein
MIEKLKYIICIMFASTLVTAQLNIQTGYDIGFIDYKSLSEGNRINRINLISELKLKHNLLISVDLGYDNYNRKREEQRSYFTNSSLYVTEFSNYNIKRYVKRLNLSLGYEFIINGKNSLTTKISSGISSISQVKILESNRGKQIFTGFNGDIIFEEYTFYDFSNDYIQYNYPNKFISTINPLNLSIEYRYKLNKFSLNSFFGYSPFKTPFLFFKSFTGVNNLFLIGFRIGYEIPFSKQKS